MQINPQAYGDGLISPGMRIDVQTPKLRTFTGKVLRIDKWSHYPVKLEHRTAEGILVREAVNLAECCWSY